MKKYNKSSITRQMSRRLSREYICIGAENERKRCLRNLKKQIAKQVNITNNSCISAADAGHFLCLQIMCRYVTPSPHVLMMSDDVVQAYLKVYKPQQLLDILWDYRRYRDAQRNRIFAANLVNRETDTNHENNSAQNYGSVQQNIFRERPQTGDGSSRISSIVEDCGDFSTHNLPVPCFSEIEKRVKTD
ncbi:hypothetical protein KJ807_05505 [Patescibacteria group bacterium]|nr:hypothetical protein [Patescibacteria group bacterium]